MDCTVHTFDQRAEGANTGTCLQCHTSVIPVGVAHWDETPAETHERMGQWMANFINNKRMGILFCGVCHSAFPDAESYHGHLARCGPKAMVAHA